MTLKPADTPWTPAEDAILRRMCSTPGMIKALIVQDMRRTPRDVTRRMKVLGLTLPRRANLNTKAETRFESGGIPDGHVPGAEALKSRARQLAACIKAGEPSVWHLRHEHGYTQGALEALLESGRRWFLVTPMGVRLTEHGRLELLGGRAA